MITNYIIGGVIGAVLGFGYYKVVGCASGTCPLTSNPWISTLFGMFFGGLIAGSFR
jgi:hypothetical protein